MVEPGDLYFGQSPEIIKTVLGSCVAIVVWHPTLKIGGLCHYLNDKPQGPDHVISFRYGNYALAEMLNQMKTRANPQDYQVSLFGGSDMFEATNTPSIGTKNVLWAKQWLQRQALSIKHEDSLGKICRTISVNLSNGAVDLKRYKQSS